MCQFFSDKVTDHIAFSTNRKPVSWLEPKLCPFEDKMLSQIPWPGMNSISDVRGHRVLKVGVWGDLIWHNIYAEFQPNRKGSVSKWPKFARFGVEWPTKYSPTNVWKIVDCSGRLILYHNINHLVDKLYDKTLLRSNMLKKWNKFVIRT